MQSLTGPGRYSTLHNSAVTVAAAPRPAASSTLITSCALFAQKLMTLAHRGILTSTADEKNNPTQKIEHLLRNMNGNTILGKIEIRSFEHD